MASARGRLKHLTNGHWVRSVAAAPTSLAVRTRGATEAVGPNLDPKQCALLVLGCETNVLSAIPNSVALTLKINAAIDIVRRHGGSIGFMRIAFSDLDYQSIPSTNKEFSALAHQRRYRNGTSDADLHPALAVQPDDVVVRATRLGAFSTTDLDEQLTNLGVTTLFICGVDSTGVVLSTVRDAADRDYRLIVLADCTADPDRTAHDLLMSRIIPRQAEVTTVARLYRWFSPAHAGAPDNHSRTRSTAS